MGARANAYAMSEGLNRGQDGRKIPASLPVAAVYQVFQSNELYLQKLHIDANFKRVVVIEPCSHLQTLGEKHN